MAPTTKQKELTKQAIRKIAALRIETQGLTCTVDEYIQRVQQRAEKSTRVIPARVVLDVDEQTGREFAYEWKSGRDSEAGEWLNLTNDRFYPDSFMKSLELDILYVEFAGLRKVMDGPTWRAAGSPRFLRAEG